MLSTGSNYSRLVLEIQFEPLTNRFFLRLYYPRIALIVLSWLAFWLNPGRIERTALTLATVLAMIFVLSNGNSDNTSPNYVMLIDYWNAASCIFVFGAFIESVLVSQTGKSRKDSQVEEEASNNKRLIVRLIQSTNPLDTVSRIVFPAAYIIFLVYYWRQCSFVSQLNY